ncbi:MAG: B12-binding domain-containing radical SAM protein [Chloroflexi bacterium]|nr:B12-binding domain-containing radical SAM protein [Chloroflexota bacterium]
MRIDIIVVYMQRYERGHEINFVPPITGLHLAALTPSQHHVRVIHQQVDPIRFDTDADLIALSFFSGFAPEAYRLAREFKRRGKIVVAGGPHATFWADEVLAHDCDAVVIGEAESVWTQLLDDAERGMLQEKYFGMPTSLENLPTPRYDLLSPRFFVRRVIQATRGCPFSCSFCSVPSVNPGYRMRPVADVIRDFQATEGTGDTEKIINHAKRSKIRNWSWWQRKVVWFWDDNLTARRAYVKELLRAMIPLKKWWLTQASMDIAQDPELLDLMQASGCIGVFFGIESFGKESLQEANKRQNRVEYYRECIEKMHQRGIAVMAGFIAGFDGDTTESIVQMADHLYEIGVDVPFLSVLTPYKGTPLFDKLEQEDKLLKDRGWQFYNGYNVAFQPRNMRADELLSAHRKLWRTAFSPLHVFKRIARSALRLRIGALFLSLAMNSFYGWKALRGNAPVDMCYRTVPIQVRPMNTLLCDGQFIEAVATASRVSIQMRREL